MPVDRETERLRQLHATAADLASTTSADALCGALHMALVGAMQAQTTLIADASAHLPPLAWRGWPDADVAALAQIDRALAPLFDAGLTRHEPVFIEDGRQLRAAYPSAANVFDRQHTEALVVVPLQTPHGSYGVMAIGFGAPRRFSVADRLFIESLAGHGAGTLERIALLADRERLLRERDILLTTLSHDLKNPITVIGMHTHMMRQGDEKARQRATAIQQASDRMLHLVENLHDFTDFLAGHGLGHVELQSVCPKTLTEAALLDVAHLLGARRLTIQPQLTTGLPPIRCDVNRLQRSVVNILAHGLRRSPSGGTIRVDLHRTAAGTLTLDVADEGAAIGPDDDEAVFDAYCHTTKGGSYMVGLGMVVARHIAEAHGGTLTLVDSPGCLVRLTLP
jgi:signal transduction histidine kinase